MHTITAMAIVRGDIVAHSDEEFRAAYQHLIDSGRIWCMSSAVTEATRKLIKDNVLQPFPRNIAPPLTGDF